MSGSARRFFWGQTLNQALARAARHHGVAPERLAFRVRDKGHGYVRHRRAVLIEVDPAAPLAPAALRPAPTTMAASPIPSAPRPAPSTAVSAAVSAPGAAERGVERDEPSWDAPDAESELAAAEAARRLMTFAGLALEATVRSTSERLSVELAGADAARLREGGTELLNAVEALLPRAIVALCGRRVRCRVDGAGLRSRHEDELRALAREAASQARRLGEHLLKPLAAAERRIVHLELQDEPDLATESLGRGTLKRVRVVSRAATQSR